MAGGHGERDGRRNNDATTILRNHATDERRIRRRCLFRTWATPYYRGRKTSSPYYYYYYYYWKTARVSLCRFCPDFGEKNRRFSNPSRDDYRVENPGDTPYFPRVRVYSPTSGTTTSFRITAPCWPYRVYVNDRFPPLPFAFVATVVAQQLCRVRADDHSSDS